MAVTDRSDAALLRALGHTPLGIEVVDRRAEFPQARVKHFFECGCGYRSTARGTMKDAVGAGVHHMRTEAKKIRSNGGVSPRDTAAAG